MSGELSDKLPSQFSGLLSESLSPLKDKEKDKDNSITNARVKKVLGLDDLERMFLADQDWIESVFRLLLSKGMTDASIEMVKEKVSMFFQYLRATGQSEREKNDCKNHFVNWLVKQPLNNKFSKGMQTYASPLPESCLIQPMEQREQKPNLFGLCRVATEEDDSQPMEQRERNPYLL